MDHVVLMVLIKDAKIHLEHVPNRFQNHFQKKQFSNAIPIRLIVDDKQIILQT